MKFYYSLFTLFLAQFIALFLTLLVHTTAVAQSVKLDADDAINSVFSRYMQRYNTFLHSGELPLTDVLYSPQVMVINSRGNTVVTRDEFNTQVVNFLTRLKNNGVARVNWEDVNINLLSDNVALVSNKVVRYKPNGKIYNQVGATYFVNKVDENWFISAFTVHQYESVISD